ncbi:cupin [Aliterella atlantica CENA595]|uniref:Cupin n=1 Tax=Aliterella atlantica CENA595 TaxID=1618023 RepID=A0A0D8ZN12_9CYAN|nr:cupin [Aliterella atlantica CENA595]
MYSTRETAMQLLKKFGSFFPLMTLTLLGTVEIARCQTTPPPVNARTQSVTREVLASGYPSDAQGRILELVRYTIPSGVKLPPHTHPGMQIGRVEFGTLTYTVVRGAAKIIRANRSEETLQAGQTTLLKVGDSLIEPGGMVHYGKNESASIVILLNASLFDAKRPKAILTAPK